MTKKQKIWLGIFLAMFIVPEILWGALLGILSKYLHIDALPIIKSSSLFEDNIFAMNAVLIIEISALIGIERYNYLFNKSVLYKRFISILIYTFLVVMLLVFSLYNSLSHLLS